MSAAITIYSQGYTYKGNSFSVWSYLDDPDPERSTLLFAYRVDGVTREDLPDRKEALSQARRRLDALPDRPDEKTPVDEAPMAVREQHQQQQDLSRRPDLPRQQGRGRGMER